jgi:hypothetical protein
MKTNIIKGIYMRLKMWLWVSTTQLSASSGDWEKNPPDAQLVTTGAPFHFYFGLRRGASAFDRFRMKWINTSNIVN